MNKNSLLELERLFKRIKRKMGHFDYYETNLGIVVYNKVDEGEIIEFSDINYGTYRIVSNDDVILFSYVNDMFRTNVSKNVDKMLLIEDYVFNKTRVVGLNCKLVLRDGCEVGCYNDKGIIDNYTHNTDNYMSDDEIITVGNNCVDGVNANIRNSYLVFSDIIKSRNKIKKRIMM